MKIIGRIPPSPVHRPTPPVPITDGPSDDLQAATIELMHSVSRLAVATFAANLVEKANDAHLYEFSKIISDTIHDYIETGRYPS